MSADSLAKRFGLTSRQIRYWRKKGYVPAAKKDGSTWIYDLVAHRRLALVARLLKDGASANAAFAAVGAIEQEAPKRLRAPLHSLQLYVVGDEILATDGKVMFNPVTRTLVHPILVGEVYSSVDDGGAAKKRVAR
jgi:DNA-binding transcriptional MerR regulator